jgi:hypothetical protein
MDKVTGLGQVRQQVEGLVILPGPSDDHILAADRLRKDRLFIL